ncbi:hypothetical protein BBO99_00007731 [Phytophthora kernoviae]|uniref:Uncharacterized protein n=2 Tax=Phytophthora kernoviae TaxID=325452 RepID=A0A3R7KGI7_9STRA|nr:hypothetical protein G195_008829 [Phytophthora kernoviae 00238/432]KAG2518177.1 hypothetical protein JM16_007396 [Phytophthora kernoviae]KAG2519971.1 hypothetical protein JM18_007374 [Phytophthora kernoviae]RLN05757.1 hypothetical protein BBI17_007662 [Phytophthora kernoviae]RLN76224.1 hypothetical protein BBO99_00007731 [Phytophthora kernoviae]
METNEKYPGLESGAALMTHGPQMLHDYIATRFEAAMGRPLPQMEKCVAKMLAKKNIVRKDILKDVSGIFKPDSGSITLILVWESRRS